MFLSRSWRPLLPWLIGILSSLIFLVIAEKPWADGLDTSATVKESIRTHSWAVIGLWWGAVINLAIGSAVVAFLFLRRNHRPEAVSALSTDEENPLSKREQILYQLAIVAMAILGAVMMFPRLNLSLWGDEQATTSRYIVGYVYRVGENQDEFVLKTPRWEKTLFNWGRGPSNQVMFSALARLAHGAGDVSGENPGDYYFTEWKIRLPSYLAGIGAIFSTCWLVWLLGAPRGAPVAGFLMAMHPLLLRYSTEARGYALLLFFGPLAVCFLIRALQTTRLRWWIPFGIVQFFLLWSYFGSVYLLVPLNAAAIWLAWDFRKNRNPLKSGQLWRYAGATILGAMLTIQLMLPNLLQLPAFLESGRLNGTIDLAWIQDSLSFWASGMPWRRWEMENPNSLVFGPYLKESQMFYVILLAVLFGVVSGIWVLARRTRWRIFLLVLAAPVLLMIGHAYNAENLLYPWYTVGFIPLGMVLVTLGYTNFAANVAGKSKWTRPLFLLTTALAGSGGLCLFDFTSAHRNNIRHNSIEPLAESTRHFREVVNPFHPEIDSVKSLSFHHYSRLYDPAGLVAKSDDEFIAVLQKIDAEGTPLWVNTAHIEFGKRFFPKAFALLENRDVFEEPAIFWGMQQPCTRSVFRYKPGGLARAGVK